VKGSKSIPHIGLLYYAINFVKRAIFVIVIPR